MNWYSQTLQNLTLPIHSTNKYFDSPIYYTQRNIRLQTVNGIAFLVPNNLNLMWMDDWNVAGWLEVGKSAGDHWNEGNNSQFFSLFFYTRGSWTFPIQWPSGECVLKPLFLGCRFSSLCMLTPGMSSPDSRVVGLEPPST